MVAQLVEQLTRDPEFKGFNPPVAVTRKFFLKRLRIRLVAIKQLVKQSISDPMFKGLNPAATGTGKNNKKFGG